MFLGHLEERFNTIEEKVAAILFHVSVISQVEKQINELKDQIKTLSNRINAHLVATIDYEMNDHCGICEQCEFKQDDDKSEDDEF
jgi:7-cyano-7-deazaguanine synthase in queuosine biosynthesis